MALEIKYKVEDVFESNYRENGLVYAVFRHVSRAGQNLSILNSKAVKEELGKFLESIRKFYSINDNYNLAEKCKEIVENGFDGIEEVRPFAFQHSFEIQIQEDGSISIRYPNADSTEDRVSECKYSRDKESNLKKKHTEWNKGYIVAMDDITFLKNTDFIIYESKSLGRERYIRGEYWFTDSNGTQFARAIFDPIKELKEALCSFPTNLQYCFCLLGPKENILAIRNPNDPTRLLNAINLGKGISCSDVPKAIEQLGPNFVQELLGNPKTQEYCSIISEPLKLETREE